MVIVEWLISNHVKPNVNHNVNHIHRFDDRLTIEEIRQSRFQHSPTGLFDTHYFTLKYSRMLIINSMINTL